MRSKVIFGHPKWLPAAIFFKNIYTMFVEPTAGRLQLDINSLLVNIYIYRHVCWERGNIHCVRPLWRMHTVLVILAVSPFATLYKCTL